MYVLFNVHVPLATTAITHSAYPKTEKAKACRKTKQAQGMSEKRIASERIFA